MGTTSHSDNYRLNLLTAGHNFKASGGLAYKALLIKGSPGGTYDRTLANVGTPGTGSPSTTNVGTDEASGAGVTSGGVALTNVNPALSSGEAVSSFSTNPTWTGATTNASGMVVYTNDSTAGAAGRTVGYYDFGGTQSVVSGTLTVVLPANAAGTALIRIT